MPHDVTMPQLGMAQDAGKLVAWLKGSGDAVSKGDALFEVETDKATMEVEAQASGFLTGVAAQAGDDVPVGQVIARITDSPEDETAPPAPAGGETAPDEDALPGGQPVSMPQLGMAQDCGLLVSWHKAPGDAVAADDVLFEVETDKSTMEVPAGVDGYLAATLAEAGQEVPVGAALAIISATKLENPVARRFSAGETTAHAAPPRATAPAQTTERPQSKQARPAAVTSTDGRILASPKARRLALKRGLDLARLVKAGHPQPYHVADLDVLAALPAPSASVAAAPAVQRLTAELDSDGVGEFIAWAKGARLTDADALLAGLAGASLPLAGPTIIGIERFGAMRSFSVPEGRNLSQVGQSDDQPALLLRDLRGTRLRHIELGAGELPTLTITDNAKGLSLTLECSPAQLDARDAITLLTEFAGRLEQPLRHLL